MKAKERKISFVNILSKDQKRLVEFYKDVMNLDTDSSELGHWFGFNTDGATLGIEPMSNRDKYEFEYEEGNPVLIQFEADSYEDLKEWTEDLESKGVEMGQRLLDKSYGMVSTFTDPDGNVIELLYEDKK